MKKIDVGQMLNTLANVGVVAGIIFLGLEIRQNSEALLAGSRQDLLDADLGILDNLMDYPQLYYPGNTGNLTGEDVARRDVYFVSILRVREFAWQQYQNDLLDEQSFRSYLAPLGFVFNSEDGREFLLGRGFAGDAEFKEYVIDYLALEE